jgi:hypothetical protein
MPSIVDHIIGAVDRAAQTMPDSQSVDDLVAWADRVGEATLWDILNWQPKLAVVITMPKRWRRRGQR